MSVINVTIDAKEALKYLDKLPAELDKALTRGIAKIAYLFEGAAKKVTPVDTGRLRASIFTITEHLQAMVSTNVNYAVYVHDGTRFMNARPFMQWALDDSKNKFGDILKDELTNALQ